MATSTTELLQELRELHETMLDRPLPFPAALFGEEVERLFRELDPARKVRELFQTVLEEARSARLAFEDLSVLRRTVLRERVEIRRTVRQVLGVSERGTLGTGANDDQLVEGWRTHLRAEEGRAEITIEGYNLTLDEFRRFLAPRGLRLKEVDRDVVIAYKEALVRAANRAATINRKIVALRSFYNYLLFAGEIEKDPLRFVRRLKPEQRRLPILVVKEIEQLVSAIDLERPSGFRDYTMVMLFCATGARLGEVIRLKVQDIDFARGVVTYRSRKNKDDAQIVLTPNVQAVFKHYLAKVRPKLLKKVKNPEWRDMFMLSSHGRPFHRGSVSNLLALYGKKAGLEKHVSAHTFRRSIATTLANNGMPAELLKVFLGHRSINTTLNHYVVYADEAQRRAVEDYHPMALGKLLPDAAVAASKPRTSPQPT